MSRATESVGRRAPTAEPTSWLQNGQDVGAWTITDLLAVGGCGAVYTARHRVLERCAAIKVLHTELAARPAMVRRFVHEARAVNHIRHPNIIDVFDFGELSDGRPYFAMELLSPDDLHHRIARRGAFPPDEALALLAPIARALEASHAVGYVHRDLKASNVGFLPLPGGGEVVKLLDFGVAKLLEPDGPAAPATERLGTLHSMAPEQLRGGPIGPPTDVYALGVLLHHVVTGRLPFEAVDPIELERLHLEAPPPAASLLAPVPRAIDAVIAAAMAKAPADRPAGAARFLDALRRAVAGSSAPSVRQEAMAVHVAVPTDGIDEESVDRTASALALARRCLTGVGFEIAVDAATSLLGVLRLPAGGAARAERRGAGLAAARAIARAIAPVPSIHVHAGEVDLRGGEIAGGPLLDVGRWLPAELVAGLCVSALAAGEEGER